MKYTHYVKTAIFIIAVLPSVCIADNPGTADMSDYPDRIMSLNYSLRGDLYFLDHIGSAPNKIKYDEILNLMSEQEQEKSNFRLEGMLVEARHTCHVQLLQGFFCGLPRLIENDEGDYLFVTDPIQSAHGDYIILVDSMGAPERTVILLIKNRHAEVIYDSFKKQNICSIHADFPKLNATRLLRVESNTTFQITDDSYHHIVQDTGDQSRDFEIKIDESGCALAQITRTK